MRKKERDDAVKMLNDEADEDDAGGEMEEKRL